MNDELALPQHQIFASIRQIDADGNEFWSSRDFSRVLGYADYRNFEQVIQKAQAACINSNHSPSDHFGETTEMITIGKGAQRSAPAIALSRYACYLII